MIQVYFSPFLEAEMENRQKELHHEMELIRLADSLTRNNSSSIQAPTKVLARIGKRLVSLGTTLEQRYGQKLTDSSLIEAQTRIEGCS